MFYKVEGTLQKRFSCSYSVSVYCSPSKIIRPGMQFVKYIVENCIGTWKPGSFIRAPYKVTIRFCILALLLFPVNYVVTWNLLLFKLKL